MIEGLIQALHLSKKQSTIPAKIHTEKEIKYFFDGAGNSYMSEGRVWKPSALLPSSDGFQRLCLWPSPRCHGTCLYTKPPAAGSARKCPSRAWPEERPAIFNSKWTFSCYYLVFGLLQPINRNYTIHYIYLFPALMERAQAAGQHPSPAEPFQLLAMDSTSMDLPEAASGPSCLSAVPGLFPMNSSNSFLNAFALQISTMSSFAAWGNLLSDHFIYFIYLYHMICVIRNSKNSFPCSRLPCWPYSYRPLSVQTFTRAGPYFGSTLLPLSTPFCTQFQPFMQWHNDALFPIWYPRQHHILFTLLFRNERLPTHRLHYTGLCTTIINNTYDRLCPWRSRYRV